MKIALSILTLGLSVWALPALATPSHQTHSNGKSEARGSKIAKHLDLDLRLDSKKGNGNFDHGNALRSTRLERALDGGDWKGQWPTRTDPGGAGALVPEPSASILFGVGLLVALQAIPRRSSHAASTGESSVATHHG